MNLIKEINDKADYRTVHTSGKISLIYRNLINFAAAHISGFVRTISKINVNICCFHFTLLPPVSFKSKYLLHNSIDQRTDTFKQFHVSVKNSIQTSTNGVQVFSHCCSSFYSRKSAPAWISFSVTASPRIRNSGT